VNKSIEATDDADLWAVSLQVTES